MHKSRPIRNISANRSNWKGMACVIFYVKNIHYTLFLGIMCGQNFVSLLFTHINIFSRTLRGQIFGWNWGNKVIFTTSTCVYRRQKIPQNEESSLAFSKPRRKRTLYGKYKVVACRGTTGVSFMCRDELALFQKVVYDRFVGQSDIASSLHWVYSLMLWFKV